MEPKELLDNLHADLKRLNISYEAHAQIQQIIQTYRNELGKKDTKK